MIGVKMLLGSLVEMEGYFFILFLTCAFLLGVLFIGYFQESKGLTCQTTQSYLTGQFILSEFEEDVNYNFADPSNLEVDANLVVVEKKEVIVLNENMVNETNRVQQLIKDGNIKVYSVKYKDLN